MFLHIILTCYLNGTIAGVVSCNFCLFVVVVFLHTVFIRLALLFCPFRKAKQTKKKTHPYNHNKFSNTKGRKAALKPYK